MTTLANSEIFFVISSIGFIVLALLAAALIILLVKATHALTRILEKVETNVDKIGDVTKDMIEDLRGNVIFRMLFRPHTKRRRAAEKKREIE